VSCRYLDWGQHIHNICNKANRTTSFLRRNLNIASTSTKETAYKALVRPTVEYASTVWDPHEKGYIHRLDMVQRRAARYVKNKYHNRSSVTDMLADLEWKSLKERRKEARLIMLYKVINNKVALDSSQLKPSNSTSTRNSHNLTYKIPYCRTQYRQQSFFPRTIKDWNSLPPGQPVQLSHSVLICPNSISKPHSCPFLTCTVYMPHYFYSLFPSYALTWQ
jgi:hypothetical protein